MRFDKVLADLALPREALVDRRVPKKMLAEQGAPTATDKRRVLEGIEELTWVAALKPMNIGVPAFKDQTREYLEIAVLTAVLRPVLRTPRQAARVVEIIHRAVPYPVILISSLSGEMSLSLAHKRWSQSERGTVVLEELRTVALHFDPLPAEESQFLGSLAVSLVHAANLYGLYDGWLRQILALEAARVTGRFTSPPTAEAAIELRRALEELTARQRQLVLLRKQAMKEKQINRRVELNLAIQRLEASSEALLKEMQEGTSHEE